MKTILLVVLSFVLLSTSCSKQDSDSAPKSTDGATEYTLKSNTEWVGAMAFEGGKVQVVGTSKTGELIATRSPKFRAVHCIPDSSTNTSVNKTGFGSLRISFKELGMPNLKYTAQVDSQIIEKEDEELHITANANGSLYVNTKSEILSGQFDYEMDPMNTQGIFATELAERANSKQSETSALAIKKFKVDGEEYYFAVKKITAFETTGYINNMLGCENINSTTDFLNSMNITNNPILLYKEGAPELSCTMTAWSIEKGIAGSDQTLNGCKLAFEK